MACTLCAGADPRAAIRGSLLVSGHHCRPVLRSLGFLEYDRFAAVQQMRRPRHSETLERDDGSRERFRFKFGSSGPFGKGLEVDWKLEAEVMDRLVFQAYRRWGDDTSWQANTALRAATRLSHLATRIALPVAMTRTRAIRLDREA